MTKKYLAIEVRQQPESPPFYLLGATATDLLEWCDVPRSKADYMAGYQRTLKENRTSALADYFDQSPNNIVPGSVIVAVDSDYVSLTDEGNGVFTLEIQEDSRTFEDKLHELFGALSTRLSTEELRSAEVSVSVPDEDIDEDAEDEESIYPKSYLAKLTAELQMAISNWESLEEPRKLAIEDYIEGASKPGLIIDGQHRIFGAKDVSKCEIFMSVVLIPGLQYAEQVFQFYVLNSKSVPLKPTELRRIVSTSLSDQEIEELYERFKRAGIDADEAKWTHELNTRPNSPFNRLIDFGFGNKGEIINENVADQVVRQFMKADPKKSWKQLIQPVADDWNDLDKRFEMFLWFWNAIYEQYRETWERARSEALLGKQHNLFLKVSLLTLQKFILDRFVTALPYRDEDASPPFASEGDVKAMVASTLKNLPGEFFDEVWLQKQMDTSEGKKELYGYMEHVWNAQGKIHRNLKLFKGGV